jgi:hypothetical protein
MTSENGYVTTLDFHSSSVSSPSASPYLLAGDFYSFNINISEGILQNLVGTGQAVLPISLLGNGELLSVSGAGVSYPVLSSIGDGITSEFNGTGTIPVITPGIGDGFINNPEGLGSLTPVLTLSSSGSINHFTGTGNGYPVINIGEGIVPAIVGQASASPTIYGIGDGLLNKPISNSYIIPFNYRFQVGSYPVDRLTGEYTDPLLNNSNGNIFISPSFFSANPVNELQVASVESFTDSGDKYLGDKKEQAPQQRPFVFGPAFPSGRPYPPDFTTTVPAYVPTFNNEFVFMGTKKNTVTGTLLNTTTMVSNNLFY